MPTKLNKATSYFNDGEYIALQARAQKAALSVSNYLRKLAGLKALHHGAKKKSK